MIGFLIDSSYSSINLLNCLISEDTSIISNSSIESNKLISNEERMEKIVLSCVEDTTILIAD